MELWKYAHQTIIIPKLHSRPLGKWTSTTHQRWNYFTNAQKSFITHSNQSFFPNHHLRNPQYTKGFPVMQGHWVADVLHNHDGSLLCSSNVIIPNTTTIVQEEGTLVESYHNISDWRKRNWGIQNLTMDKLLDLRKHLANHNVSAACDGLVCGSRASHAWCLYESDTGDIIIQGGAPVDGLMQNMTSTRTEIMAILAVTSFLDWYNKTYFKILSPIVIHSDSESAILLSRKRGMRSTKYALHNDIDCILEMQHYFKKYPSFKLSHVMGHQDKNKPFEALDTPSRMNVLMDRAAGEFIKNMPRTNKNHDRAPILPAQQICLITRGRGVTFKMYSI